MAARLQSSTKFLGELNSMKSVFAFYENKSNQAAARAEVPHEYLKAIAQAKYESSDMTANNSMMTSEDEHNIVQDMFLLELMEWFKNNFFTWVNSPDCPLCTQATTSIGNGIPNPIEISQSAGRVEIFTCRNCFQDNREVARFPRINDPVVLLKTRRGRCGEWANCFALICRAMGFEVRYVRDWTDHVWVEVFSCSLKPNRWVHCDPCENSYDSPLLYSTGWGKKLTYVIGISHDDIQDVTWRYIPENTLSEVLSRRNFINEVDLVQEIMRHKSILQANLQSERKSVLKLRMIQELAEFLYPRHKSSLKDSEKVGRESGSLAWRLARQELGSDDGDISSVNKQYVWEVGTNHVSSSGKFILMYNCAKDQYIVTNNASTSGHELMSNWSNGVYQNVNVFRKEEKDWKMAYLALNDDSGCNQGTISWQFKMAESNFEIIGVDITSSIAIFNEVANISATLTDDKGTSYKLLDTNQTNENFNWNSKDINGGQFIPSKVLTLTFNLQGGNGNTGWQHAQLFRTSTINSNQIIGLQIKLDIKPTH